LLGELGAEDAIGPMLRLLARTDWSDALHDDTIFALRKLGARVIEPALQALSEQSNTTFRQAVASVLSELGVRDARILAVLVDVLHDDVTLGAANLAQYGDPGALPHLSRALDEYEIEDTVSPLANHAVVELEAAIDDLGGTLSAEQQLKCRLARAPAERFRRKMNAAMAARSSSVPAVRQASPGRNAPCWCGSGVKYKKCHLRTDESSAR
jgi:HEAT repeat protein